MRSSILKDEGLTGNNHSSVRIIIQYNTSQLKSSSIGIFTPIQSPIPAESGKLIFTGQNDTLPITESMGN